MLLGSLAGEDPHMAIFTNLAEYKHEQIPEDPLIGHPNAGKPCVEEIAPRQYRINFAIYAGRLPDVHKETSRAAVLAAIVEHVRSEIEVGGVEPDDILVLTPRKPSELELLCALEAAGLRCHAPRDHGPRDPRRARPGFTARDFRREQLRQPGHVAVSTIKGSKGYTGHIVHVAFIDELEGDGERGAVAAEQKDTVVPLSGQIQHGAQHARAQIGALL